MIQPKTVAIALCASLVTLFSPEARAQDTLPEGFALPNGTVIRLDGSAILPNGRALSPQEAASGMIVKPYEHNCSFADTATFVSDAAADFPQSPDFPFRSTYCVEMSNGQYWSWNYASSAEQADRSAREACEKQTSDDPSRFGPGIKRACHPMMDIEFVAVKIPQPAAPVVAVAAMPGVVVTAESVLDASLEYPPLRLLAYSINDNQRSADSELVGYFVAAADGAGVIVEGQKNAPVMNMFATGQDTVVFVTGMDSPQGPLFLVANEDGATFEPAPAEGSYFFLRQPLEPSAAAQGFVSLESQLFPGQFLRHSGFRLSLDPIDPGSSSLDRRDATFLALADGAEIPVIGGGDDALGFMVTSVYTSEEVTLETAIYQEIQNNFLAMSQTETLQVSLFVSIITSLYQEIDQVTAERAVLTLFGNHGITSIDQTITVATLIQVYQAGTVVSGAVNFSIAAHFEAMLAVDMTACGVEQGGFGGFGDREVPTNSHGDVHIFTPDGLTYDFQDGGEFILLASQDGQAAVHTRQTVHANDTTVSSNTAVAFLVGTDVLEFYSDEGGQRFYLNGESHSLPETDFQFEGGGALRFDGQGKSGPRYLIDWPNGELTARVNIYAGFLNVGVSATAGVYSGLIGNLDGNPLNDMLPRRGAQLICPPADAAQLARFGDSWRLTVDQTLLRSELSEELLVLVTEVGTGAIVGVETALYDVLQTNFVGLDASQSIDIDLIVTTLTALYDIDQEVAVQTVVNFFGDQGVTSVTDSVTYQAITQSVTVYQERRETRSVETLDIELRARAQRFCEAGGITDPLALANCTLDVAYTADETYLHSATSFQQMVVDLPQDRRQVATAFSNPLAPTAILPQARVIEIVGPPTVVPTIEEIVRVQQSVETRSEERIITQTTSDITVTVNLTACSEVEGLRSPAEVLEEQPQAGGVAIFCATHARGQTVTIELGRTLEEALARAEASCPAEAETRIDRFGEIVIPCREIGRGEREFDFGGGVLTIGRDVQITLTERRVEKVEVPAGFGIVYDPNPGLTASCMEGESVPLDGLTVVDGLLSYQEGMTSDFQNLCSEVSFEESEEDYYLQATCFTADAADVRTSAVTLLGVAAIETLISHPNCAPAPEPVEMDESFVVFAEDGLEALFPDRGDFVLIRSQEAGIEVHARRDLWVSDRSETVFTALMLQIGNDLVEIYAAPEPGVTVNGLPLESAAEPVGDVMVLAGGGTVTVEGTDTLIFTWPETSFAISVTVYAGSHLSPGIRIDEALTYEGLARFTADWMLEVEASGFSVPLGGDPSCNCAD